MIISPLGQLKRIVSIFVSHITENIGHNVSALKEIHTESCLKNQNQKKTHRKNMIFHVDMLKYFEETDHLLGAKAFPAYHVNEYLTTL